MSEFLLKDYTTKQLILIGLVAGTPLHTPVWFLALMCRAELMRRTPEVSEKR